MPEPEPELDVKPPGHDDGHVPYLEERIDCYFDLEIMVLQLFAITCQPHLCAWSLGEFELNTKAE